MTSYTSTTESELHVSLLHYHQRSRKLDVKFSHGETASFSAEFLRVLSPSAEVRRHGKPVLVTNKKNVTINKVLPVGHYAVKLVFDDGHDSGIYSWRYLHQLAAQQDTLWQQYLTQLRQANAQRDELIAVTFKP